MIRVCRAYTATPEAAHTARYTSVKTTTGTPFGPGAAVLCCVAPYSPIMGSALGSIMAVIITAQPATKVTASASVSGMYIVIIMSGAPRLERTTSIHAAAATTTSTTDVTTVARSLGGATRSWDAGVW